MNHSSDHIVGIFIFADPSTISHTWDEEEYHHNEEQALHEWCLTNDGIGFGVA